MVIIARWTNAVLMEDIDLQLVCLSVKLRNIFMYVCVCIWTLCRLRTILIMYICQEAKQN